MRSFGVEPVGESCEKKSLRTMSRLCAAAAFSSDARRSQRAEAVVAARLVDQAHGRADRRVRATLEEGRLRAPAQADAAAAGTSEHATVAATMHRVRCRAMEVGWEDLRGRRPHPLGPRILPDSGIARNAAWRLVGRPGISDRVGRIEAMIFTTKAEYGVRLLVELGRQGSGQPGLAQGDRRGRGPAARLPRAHRRPAEEGRPRREHPRRARRLPPVAPRASRSRWTRSCSRSRAPSRR